MNQGTDKNTNSYLTFVLGEEFYATHVDKVLNILEMVRITKMPNSPSYMKGVINLRGKILPVIETRHRLRMESVPDTQNTCIIVMSIEINDKKIELGAIVDSVVEVIEIDDEDILPVPNIGNKYQAKIISGMVNKGDYFIMLLNANNLFSIEDIISMEISGGWEKGK